MKKKHLKQVWVSEKAHKDLKVVAASSGKSMSQAFEDLVSDSKNQRERWGRLF